ncbi:SAM-dependent methyltransferase [Nonomuraea polychroma]|uniref:SAM-dependent methyltransferase n=1 Tax=Nonomuraea polychroma TaxID=46176 RepID=UPI003D8D5FE7
MDLDWESGLDPHRPNSARMYNFFIGGKDWYPADVAAAQRVLKLTPDTPKHSRENRYFLRRVVTHLSQVLGVTQFLDIGAGLPTHGNVHEIAPTARVVYVDNDPVVIATARALMAETDKVRIVHGDVRRPEQILSDPTVRTFLDWDAPMALLMVGLLHFVTDDEGAYGAVATFRDALPIGSYLALSHGWTDGFREDLVRDVGQVYSSLSFQLRTHAQVASFFDGFDLVEPGLVHIPDWHPDGISEGLAPESVGMGGGVGRVRR